MRIELKALDPPASRSLARPLSLCNHSKSSSDAEKAVPVAGGVLSRKRICRQSMNVAATSGMIGFLTLQPIIGGTRSKVGFGISCHAKSDLRTVDGQEEKCVS